MALIIYPTDDYNSYLSVADCDALVVERIVNQTNYDALTTAQKEIYLRQATLLIKNTITDPEEDSTPENLRLATMYLLDFGINKDLTNNDGNDNVKVLKIEGAIEKQYFTKGDSSNAFPDLVISLLQDYNFSGSASTFRFNRS